MAATLTGTGSLTLSSGLSATSGTFTGITNITNTTASSSTTTGALVVSGGIGVGGDMSITGYIACNRVSVSNVIPSSSSHLTSKSYVDGLVVTASGNLTKTGVNITLNPSISLTDVTCSGNVTCSTVPSSGGNLFNKTYVDNAITTSVSNVVTAVSTTDFFSISGLTFTGLSKELTYSKVGKFVFCNLKVTWTSASGTAAAIYPNVTVGTPFPSLHRDRWIQVESQWYQNDLPVDRGKYQYPAPANSVTFKIDPSLLNNHLIGGELYVTFKFLTSA